MLPDIHCPPGAVCTASGREPNTRSAQSPNVRGFPGGRGARGGYRGERRGRGWTPPPAPWLGRPRVPPEVGRDAEGGGSRPTLPQGLLGRRAGGASRQARRSVETQSCSVSPLTAPCPASPREALGGPAGPGSHPPLHAAPLGTTRRAGTQRLALVVSASGQSQSRRLFSNKTKRFFHTCDLPSAKRRMAGVGFDQWRYSKPGVRGSFP